jgi:TP901 family phage tail tape measure protein
MGVRNIAVTITANSSDLRKSLLLGSSAVTSFTREVEASNRRTGLSFATMGKVGEAGLLSVAAGLVASGVAAAQFETRMRNVNSLVHLNDAQFKALSGSVLDLSTKLPQSANVLAEGLYDITSSGFSGADALTVLNKSAEAASAGLTTTATAAQAIDAVLNAYGLSAASAGDVSDTLFQTVNLGVISFEQLASTIGDVVGTAAAAHIPIAQLGAAIATMTLSGISPAEAGTSVNRLIQGLIQPSSGLATVYKSLGIESGAAALQAKGLDGVMEQLRKATGGNVTALLQLFPEQRAARGAFALMSDAGRTYVRVGKAIEDENARQGATHKALAEQMKGTSLQLKLLENAAVKTAIEIGTALLPPVQAFLRALHTAGSEAMPLLEKGISAVTPLFLALVHTGGNLVEIFADLLSAIDPVAAAMLAIAGSAVLGTLTALAKLLEGITDLAADHRTAILALAVSYGVTLIPTLIGAASALAGLALKTYITSFLLLTQGVKGTSTAVKGLTASMLTLQGVATLGLAAGVFLLLNRMSNLADAEARAKRETQDLVDHFNAFDTKKSQQELEDLTAQIEFQADVLRQFDKGFFGGLFKWVDEALPRTILGFKTGAGAATDMAASLKNAKEVAAQLNEQFLNTNGNLVALANSTGISVKELAKLAQSKDIDLSVPFFSDEATAARKQVLGLLRDMAKQAGTTGDALAAAAGLDIEKMDALSKAVAAVASKVADAFQHDTDVFASFDPGKAAAASQKASDRVASAEQHLSDVRARAASHSKQTVSDTIAIRNAQQSLSRAQDAVSASASKQSGDLAASYRQTIALASRFADDARKAQLRGLDPHAVTRLLELGPKQAEPILAKLVADHSGRLIKLVNASEQALARIGERVVEQARLTAMAIGATTDQLSRDLNVALQVSGEGLAQGSRATVASVAKALHLPKSEVARIKEEFGLLGIQLSQAVQRGVSSVVIHAPGFIGPRAPGDNWKYPAGFVGPKIPGHASGGHVSGAGTSTTDSFLAPLSHREFVQPTTTADAGVLPPGTCATSRDRASGTNRGSCIRRTRSMRSTSRPVSRVELVPSEGGGTL